MTQRYPQASSVAFTDGLNAQTTYYYHVELRDLEPDTTYYYQVSDGAAPTPSTAGASFTTAPAGRAKFRFSSYGDLATPSYDLNASRQPVARVLRQRLLRGQRDREPRRRQRRRRCSTCSTATSATPTWTSSTRPASGATSASTLPLRREPPVDARARQPRDRVRHLQPRRPARQRARRHRRPGRRGQLLERPLRLRPLPEPLPAAGQRRDQLGRQPPARQLLRLPGRHREVHLAGRRRRHLPGRRLGLPQLRRRTPRPRPTSSGAAIPNGTVTYNHGYTGDLKLDAANNSAGAGLQQRNAEPPVHLARARRCARPARTRRST